jgi:transcriptional regulator with XRE-family HTH domain
MTPRKTHSEKNALLRHIHQELLMRIRGGLVERKQRDIAKAVGVTDPQVSQLLRGNRKLTAAEFFIIFSLLDLPIPQPKDLSIPRLDGSKVKTKFPKKKSDRR